MRHLLVLCFVCLSALASAATVEHVIVAVVDGPRWSETWGDPTLANIPARAALRAQGAWFSDFANDGPTYTNAGHTALATGVYQDINNSGRELPRSPSLFQRWLQTSGAAPETAWLVTSKDKLAILSDTVDPAWHGRFQCGTDCGKAGNGSGYREDAATYERLLAVLREHHPRLLLSNFKEPDSSGHSGKWEAYLQGIRSSDALIGRLWEFLSTDPAYAGKTVLFITNDHGRHLDGVKDGFRNHGDDCAGCHKVELLALGAGIKPGTVVNAHHDLLDLAATVARLIGVELPTTGKPISELIGE